MIQFRHIHSIIAMPIPMSCPGLHSANTEPPPSHYCHHDLEYLNSDIRSPRLNPQLRSVVALGCLLQSSSGYQVVPVYTWQTPVPEPSCS